MERVELHVPPDLLAWIDLGVERSGKSRDQVILELLSLAMAYSTPRDEATEETRTRRSAWDLD